MSKFLLLLALVAGSAFGADQKISAPSGNLILDAKAGSVVKVNKTLQVDVIKNLAGTSGAPGMVPIGGMVAVMPTTHANAWQPPATGVIKDGFMRADGAVVPACADCVIPAGTVTPSMINRYPRGNTTSGSNGTGANTVTLGAANIPQMSGAFASGNESAGHTHGGSTGTESANHTHSGTTDQGSPTLYNNTGGSTGAAGVANPAVNPYSGLQHNHSFTTGTQSANHTHSFTTGGISANHTHTTTVTLGTASPTAVNNEPAYTEVVWVIRVK